MTAALCRRAGCTHPTAGRIVLASSVDLPAYSARYCKVHLAMFANLGEMPIARQPFTVEYDTNES